MKHIKLFESFEIVEPIQFGEPLNNREINLIKDYNVMYPDLILKDDNYYYIHDHRCEDIRDLPATYIHGLCSKFKIVNYTINDDHTIDVDGDVNIHKKSLTKIPLKFNIVSGYFYCSKNKLTTLEGCPKEVGGFSCAENQLTTLEGSPKEVGGDFICNFNKLTTLEGCPKEVGGSFFCTYNELTTLKGGPTSVGWNFYCSSNKLTTLEGAPEYVGRNFDCGNNSFKSVEYKGIIKGEFIYR